ncbi:P-selectin glycoprotein ligand 1 [Manis pentadactyla]|uniref:P-selectin glycoprotein ligand 1 n=1 Tax=Manis pentadactyla TaxID=143292 RepID=UPI00255C29B6|nr:P-selectin glycoprotein ligand 1 [Manis pentadactyla]
MPLQLLLLTLLGPGSSLQLWRAPEDGAKETPGLLLARSWVKVDRDLYSDMNEDYFTEGTDLPEIFQSSPASVTLSHKLLAVLGTLGQRGSAGPGTPELATLATGNPTDIDAGRTAIENLSAQLATRGIPSTRGPLTKEQVIVASPVMDTPSTDRAPSTELATMEALSIGSTDREALSVEPATTEVTTQPTASEALPMGSTVMGTLSVGPAATEALTTQSTASEALPMESTVVGALSVGPAATEALTTQPAATEALPMESTVVGALSTEPTATEALSKEPTATTAPSMERTATEALSTGPPTTRGLTTPLLMPSGTHHTTTVRAGSSSNIFINQRKNHQDLFPWSSAVPSPTEDLDRIPVRQCLLAILILALVATIFLVCTVVLAVRLSRKNHMYPVRSYSPTEMVCISSLLPEGGEGPAAVANGDVPKARGQGLKAGPGQCHEGDDLALQSFLP